jgi:alkanesulfonate monooxygenase
VIARKKTTNAGAGTGKNVSSTRATTGRGATFEPIRMEPAYRKVAAALLDYYDLGIRLLSARGYDILDDAIDFGRYVIPLVKDEVARRDASDKAA